MRFMFAALLLLITLSSVDVASAQTVEELTEQCQQGNAGGCFYLGVMYVEGTGVRQDAVTAVELFRKACDGQYAAACFNLGVASGST